MAKKTETLTVSEKLKNIVLKYYEIEVFKEQDNLFIPICFVKIEGQKPTDYFEKMQTEFKEIGFQAKFHIPTPQDIKSNKLEQIIDPNIKRYYVAFEAREFKESPKKLQKQTKIQISLAIITSALIIFSAYFYIIYIEPYYGVQYKKNPSSVFWYMFSFCVGMFLTIVVHEFGHFFFAKYHHLDTSYPYLIPGPPPLGMLGAFVKIKRDPQTRNQQFDVSVGGIVFGFIISFVLLIIGLSLSEQINTADYILLRAKYSGRTPYEEAQNISEHLNEYNFLLIWLRGIFFEKPTYSYYYNDFYLPDKIIILHPLAYAGWIGLLLSCLNLIPIPILDGGHTLKALFPGRFTRLIGLIIGGVCFFLLTGQLDLLVALSCTGAMSDLDRKKRVEVVPNPTVPLTKGRKIFALTLIGLIIILFPLTFNNLIYGIGA